MKEIPLTRGHVALVDDEDFDYLSQFKWHADKQRHAWYAKRSVRLPGQREKTIHIAMHRLIANPPEGYQVDHIDGNGLNNTRANLRVCTIAENGRNRAAQRNNRSGYKGVTLARRQTSKRWEAKIKVDGRHIRLGHFAASEDAARAYDAAAREFHGEFARLNFPNDRDFGSIEDDYEWIRQGGS